MISIIQEELVNKSFSLETEDPYYNSIELAKWIRSKGFVVLNEDVVSSSGPRTTSTVKFTLIRKIDHFSSIKITVTCKGDQTAHRLDINIVSVFETKVEKGEKIFREIFSEFYEKRWLPQVRAWGGQLSDEIVHGILVQLSPKIAA